MPASQLAIVRVAAGRVAQRTFDIVFALTVLLLASPVLIVAALAIKLDSRGPVLFRQKRMGHNGRAFRLVKLTGMYVDAKARFPELFEYAAFADDQHFKCDEDPRVTRVARVLRRFSIDELPNFWNELDGAHDDRRAASRDPRDGTRLRRPPLRLPAPSSRASPARRRRGAATSSTFRETLDLELDYLQRRSLWLDIRTIARTAWTSVRGLA